MNPLTFLGSGSLLSHSYQRCPLSSTALDLKRDVPRASSFFWPKAFIELEWGGTPGQPDHPEGPRGCDTSPVRGQGGGKDLLHVLCRGNLSPQVIGLMETSRLREK